MAGYQVMIDRVENILEAATPEEADRIQKHLDAAAASLVIAWKHVLVVAEIIPPIYHRADEPDETPIEEAADALEEAVQDLDLPELSEEFSRTHNAFNYNPERDESHQDPRPSAGTQHGDGHAGQEAAVSPGRTAEV